MDSTSHSWDSQVDDRISHIAESLSKDEAFSQKEVPGLKSLLDDYIDPAVAVDNVDFVRRLLQVFRDSTTDDTYQDLLAKHTEDEQQKIADFVAGGDPSKISEDFQLGPSHGCREELKKLQDAHTVVHIASSGITEVKKKIESIPQAEVDWFHSITTKLADFFRLHCGEIEKAGVLVYHNAQFQNWGLNIQNIPSLTCVPKTVKGIQVIVKFAKAHGMGVRCSGYRHSWAPSFARHGQILISMLNLHSATELPNLAALPLPESPPTELETIEEVSSNKYGSLVRIGAACINERLRRWCTKHNKLTLPFNIIMVEITIGGANAPICHGAGRKHATLSDLVRKIEYIDANGELRSVVDPEHLRAASGCFGLMGPVTHITLELSHMTYALTNPFKMAAICAVPPPADLPEKDIPPALLKYWTNLSPEEKATHQENFEQRASHDYYSEWFWFPYSDYSWVNTWNDTTDGSKVKEFPDSTHIFLSFVQSFAMNVMQNATLLGKLIEKVSMSEAAVTLLSRAAMFALPEGEHKTYVTDALHFQRAIQNIRVRDVEVEMPLVAQKGDPNEIDYAPVQRAWWDAILLTYANSKSCPMRMPLEMRIMGSSNVILAPQRGNSLGTCAIEVLTLRNAAEDGNDIWAPFAQAVIDKWMALRNPATGKPLRTRPHWAKEWYEFKVNGEPWLDHMMNVDYKAERQEFVDTLTAIGKEVGWTLSDIRDRFSNDLFDKLFFGSDLQAHDNAMSMRAPDMKQAEVQVEEDKSKLVY